MEEDNISSEFSDSKTSLNKLNSNVSCLTPVESQLVEPIVRNIVGQEGDSIDYVNSFQNVSLKKQNKGIRPPLVGQASSSSASSNNSVLSSAGSHKVSDTEPGDRIIIPHLGSTENVDLHSGDVFSGVNFTRGNYPTKHVLINRNEYINQRPPEGSSVHVRPFTQAFETDQECPRDQSPSSASSVTSSRPLEWDNGADVGYTQVHSGGTSEPAMSTLERMVLDSGRNLLTRSDPEGTTGITGQLPPFISNNKTQQKFKFRRKKEFGNPDAQSTPLDTCVSSDVSPETNNDDFVSPIIPTTCSGINQDDCLNSSSSNHDKKETSELKTVVFDRNKLTIFPEIKSGSSSAKSKTSINQEKHTESGSYTSSNITNSHKEKITYLSEDEQGVANISKKLSSSLEDLSIVSRQSEENKTNHTLPRSQSQLNVQQSTLSNKRLKNIAEVELPKYNMALHSLVHYNKSASSSSVATVVQGKDTSPKHNFVQTVVQQGEELIPAQLDCNTNDVHQNCVTPHLTKSVIAQFPKRSNYFNFESTYNKDSSFQNVRPDDALDKDRCGNDNNPNHSHDGVQCTGAHKRIPVKIKPKYTSSGKKTQLVYSETYLNSHYRNSSESFVPMCNSSKSLSDNKKTSIQAADSVESSTKSGEFSNDKRCSVTVEDRVNSFEYLPGDVYENNERLQPESSNGTSSISIHNQSSTNETPGENRNIWDSSENSSNTLERYVMGGVAIISDFVKGNCANDTELRKKIIRRVVEKLISKHYNDDKSIPVQLPEDIIFRPPNPVNRSLRDTERSVNRSKVPCELSSRSEKDGSTNLSSECFIPRANASNAYLPSSVRGSTSFKGHHHSTTSEASKANCFDKSVKRHPHPLDAHVEVVQNGSTSKDLTETDSSRPKEQIDADWSEPATRAERYYERKKKHGSSTSAQSDKLTLVDYLNKERENQLFWISSEIQHLINLKELLERQEEIKKGIQNLKQKTRLQKSPGKHVLKERNRITDDKDYLNPASKHHLHGNKYSLQVNKNVPLRNARPGKSATAFKENTDSNMTFEETSESWESHNYLKEIREKRAFIERQGDKIHIHAVDKTANVGGNTQGRAIYDEPAPYLPRARAGSQQRHKHPPPRRADSHNNQDGSVFVTDNGLSKKNVQTETLESVGVQTSDSVQELPVVHPNWFKYRVQPVNRAQERCKCCGSKHRVDDGKACGEENKPSVGYFITFESTPRGNKRTADSKKPNDARVPAPVYEPKQPLRSQDENKERRIADGADVRVRAGADEESERGSTSRSGADRGTPPGVQAKQIYQGAPGELQYYLLRNRPSYVSRAEDRRQCIAQMHYLRELREQNKRRLLSLTEPVAPLQPPPQLAETKRIFSTKAMRKQTEKKYRQLAEVKRKQQDMKKKEGYRTNRLMAEIFKKKLQKKVLNGQVNLSNSVSVISTL